MIREQALIKACSLLREQGKEESLARFLLMYLLDENVTTFNYNMRNELDNNILFKYFDLISEHIKNDKPLSHLVGFDYFYDRKFFVNENVLSPRMETEELVYTVLQNIEDNNAKILDMCTGSGIIAITLALELPSSNIVASDISSSALEVATKNADYHGVNVDFIQSDLFNNIAGKFDILVSNPPYIAWSEKSTLEDNVLNYDPHLALFADEDGFYFYRKILEQAKRYLNKEGKIFFEIGYNQKVGMEQLAKKYDYRVNFVKDINGKDRIAILQL